MRRPLILCALLSASACTPEEPPPPPREVDTSCGLDCEAQARYGLLPDTCFEYTSSGSAQTPPSIGVRVMPETETLEGGVEVIPVLYTESGQIRMTDYYRFDDLDLILVRRVIPGGQSVTWLGEGNVPSGVRLISATAAAGNTLVSEVTAQVNQGSTRLEETRFQVSVTAPDASRTTVPHGSFPEALQLLISETPGHGEDPVRLFARDVGFIRIDTRFSLDSSDAAQGYLLQDVRTLSSSGPSCGEGA